MSGKVHFPSDRNEYATNICNFTQSNNSFTPKKLCSYGNLKIYGIKLNTNHDTKILSNSKRMFY